MRSVLFDRTDVDRSSVGGVASVGASATGVTLWLASCNSANLTITVFIEFVIVRTLGCSASSITTYGGFIFQLLFFVFLYESALEMFFLRIAKLRMDLHTAFGECQIWLYGI